MLIRFLLLLTYILTAYGCQSTQNAPARDVDFGALNPYELLDQAEAKPGTASEVRLRIRAAQVFNYKAEYQRVISTLAPLGTDLKAAKQRDELARLRGQAWVGLGDFSQAEQALAGLASWQASDFLLLAEICEVRGDYRCSADAHIQAAIEAGLDAPELPADIHDRIWLALSRARQAPAIFSHRYHHGWWLLQEQIRTAGSITGQIDAWHTWQANFPSHPACLRPPHALRKLDDYQMPQVGLLLPITGAYASAGIAVRDGLIAAYLSEKTANKPQIKIYDTGETALALLYEQALKDGADVLVGPLIKQEVEQFVAITQFSDVPRLVLNYLASSGVDSDVDSDVDSADTTRITPLFQFGIAIEDEVASLANHVLLQGREKLLLVHSQARWSQRAFDAYVRSWPYPVTSAYFADIKNLTEAVGEAMQVAASETRNTEISNILGQELKFLPRARGDLDGVIALTTQVEAQALIPALRFHFADNLPVYATSQAARGDDLADIEDFQLTDMPVFAAPNPAQQSLHRAFGLAQNPLAELYALGFDAYRIATWLPILSPQSQVALPGASGFLWLEPGGKIRRDLEISRISSDGKMMPVN